MRKRKTVDVESGRIRLNNSYFDFGGSWTTSRFRKIFGESRHPEQELQAQHFALARALQGTIEQCCRELAIGLLNWDGNRTALWELNQKLRGRGPRD